MTCREKLAKEHPEKLDYRCGGGCKGCPYDYGYMPRPSNGGKGCTMTCDDCWDREIPEERHDVPWEEVRKLINDAAEKRDRTICVSFNPEAGLSVYVSPWPDADELYDQYQKGRITANDFREKMGLPRVKNAEQFMPRGFLDKVLHISKE